jgi:crotonobetainyl-CoA:carnitine CoA-transferase CaiB-like acyl-CoA transferase
MSSTPTASKARPLRPLKGVRIISLALNLPGPAALRRLADMGARCHIGDGEPLRAPADQQVAGGGQ